MSFTVFNNNELGLRITGVDIDGDNDTDLIICDRFFRLHIGIWLNDSKGPFVKGLPWPLKKKAPGRLLDKVIKITTRKIGFKCTRFETS